MKVYDYFPANWFSKEGIRKKRSQIEAKGMPDLTNWRFITLTLDPAFFLDEVEGYQRATDHMRRFVDKVRVHFDGEFQGGMLKQGNKLEFHSEDSVNAGWPHWHMVLNITRKLTEDEMQLLSAFWGFGRVNVKRCRGASLDYVFKYIFKCPISGLSVPEWFADYYADGRTFSRVRFWKTSKNFYTGIPPQAAPAKEQQTCLVAETVREKMDRWTRSVVCTAYDKSGNYLVSRVTEFECSKRSLFGELGVLTMLGQAVCEHDQQYKTSRKNLTNKLPKWQHQTNPAFLRDQQTINRRVQFPKPCAASSRSSATMRDYTLKAW